jgi:hypothetical protein
VPIVPALFVAWCLAYDWRKQRIVHPVYAIGGAALIASWPLRVMIGPRRLVSTRRRMDRKDWHGPAVKEWV